MNKSQKEFDLKYKTNFLEIDKKLDQIQSKVNRALKEPNKELSLPTGENVQVDKKELPKLNNETIEKYNDVDDKYLSSLIKENKQQIAMLKQYDPKSQDIGKKAAKELVNLILKNKDQNITPIQKDQLNKKVINIQSQFKKNGIDINKTMDNQKKTITVNNNVQKIQEKTMKSHRAVGFDNSNRAIESLKKDVKETEQPRDTKRELTKRLEAVKNLVKQAVIDNSKDIDSKINQIKKLQGSIKNYKSDRNTSPSERFKNRKAIETITEKIGKLVKATEPLIKAAPKGTISKEVSQTIRDAKSITINRSKGMSR